MREALVNAVLSADCNLASEITVGDIGMGVLSGGGNLNLDFGGASAETDDLAATSPFGMVAGPRCPRRHRPAATPATAAAQAPRAPPACR